VKRPWTDRWRRIAGGREAPRGAGVVLQAVLVFLSLIYGIPAMLLLWLRAARRVRLPVPVISVGNLVVGGTGKTPFVIYLARRLAREGRRVAVVSRGYGRRSRGIVVVSRGERPVVRWEEAGDEPYLVALLTKGVIVVVAERRADGVRYAVDHLGADAILLDDAFQHVQLRRDLDIVVADAEFPVGNGHLLPGGILREHPLGIGRADLIVATRADGPAGARRVSRTIGALAPAAAVIETRMKPVELWDVGSGKTVKASELREGRILAVSSIANPEFFETMLEELGFDVAVRSSFPDHHRYGARDLARLEDAIEASGAAAVVTTEKDAVRLAEWCPSVPLVALGIELEVTRGEDSLARALERTIMGDKAHGA